MVSQSTPSQQPDDYRDERRGGTGWGRACREGVQRRAGAVYELECATRRRGGIGGGGSALHLLLLCILTAAPQLLLLLMDLNDNAVVTSFGRVGGGKRRKGRDVHSMGCLLMHYERVVVCCAYRVPFDASSPPDGVELLKTRYFGPSAPKTDAHTTTRDPP